MARSSAVLAALLLSLGIALVLPQLVLCVATMTHSEGQENFDPSLSTPTLTHEYEVFVSFRGADTRTSFTSHLFAALDRERIGVYRDDINLPRGGEIGLELLKAIETSRIAVVVFSKNYGTSDWCLDELVKIMECKKLLNQRVLPIFYDVSQSEVLEQKGIFAEALLKGPEDKVHNWRAALTEAADLAGLQLEKYSLESEFIEEIVENIWTILNEESATAPSRRQIDVSAQHSEPIISPQNDASRHNHISEWTPLFFFFKKILKVRKKIFRSTPLASSPIPRGVDSFIHPFRSLLFSFFFFFFIATVIVLFLRWGVHINKKYLSSLLSFIQERQVRGKCETAWGLQIGILISL